jgi:hypothetical protein
MWVMAVVAVAPCQCLWPGGHQMTSRVRISSFCSPSHWVQPLPAVTISVCPQWVVCQAERAPGSKVLLRGGEAHARVHARYQGDLGFKKLPIIIPFELRFRLNTSLLNESNAFLQADGDTGSAKHYDGADQEYRRDTRPAGDPSQHWPGHAERKI